MAEANLSALATRISHLQDQTLRAAAQQVNYWLTARNWLIGAYIVAYEQQGADRAAYGTRLMPELADKLRHVKGLSVFQLYRCVDFYQSYPHILATASQEFQ